MTGCYRPAINTFIEARKQRIEELNAAHGLASDPAITAPRPELTPMPFLNWSKGSKKKS